MRNKKYTTQEAVDRLKNGESFNVDMLASFGMTMDHFLRLAQMPDETYKTKIAAIIAHFDGKTS